MKKILLVLLALTMIFSLAACAGGGADESPATSPSDSAAPSEEASPSAETDSSIVIGLSMSEVSDNSNAYQQAYEAAAAEKGIELFVTNAKGDVATQLGDIETMITREVDVIHVRPLDPDGVAPAIEAAREAGIPVLVSEFDINCDVDCYLIATQNYCGQLQAQVLIEKLEADPELQINIGYLWGSKARGSSVQQRYQGFMDTIQSYIDSGRVVIMEEQEANFKSDEANAFVEDWLQRDPDMNCIVAQNDEMANGAVQALKTNNVDFSKFYVLGINGTEVGLQNVRDGYMLGTVNMHEPDAAVLGFEYAYRLAQGETFSETVDYSGDLFELITIDSLS